MKSLKSSIRFFGAAFLALVLFQSASNANATLTPLPVTVSIPENWKSAIVRQDFENESIFSFKSGDDKTAFLFSVTRVTSEQWLSLKDQVKNATVIKNEGGYIVFVQKTDAQKIKGDSNVEYQQLLLQLDAIIKTVSVGS